MCTDSRTGFCIHRWATVDSVESVAPRKISLVETKDQSDKGNFLMFQMSDLKRKSRKIVMAFSFISRRQGHQVGWLPYPMTCMNRPTCDVIRSARNEMTFAELLSNFMTEGEKEISTRKTRGKSTSRD